MSTKLSNRLNPCQDGTKLKANQSLNRLQKKPLSRATTQAITLGMAVSLSAAPVWAEGEGGSTLEIVEVEGLKVDDNPYAEKGAPYKVNESGDRRRVKPLAETPQTIQVITQTQLKESGKTDLKEILQTQPGITVGTGEGGNMFGDRYIIRGHEARSDVFVDGMRDPGMTTRESFATEQIEITKGPSSTFAGRGSTGGAVNSITKQANLGRSFNKLSGGFGSDEYHRYTLDSNIVLTDDMALRLNILDAYEEVPDRAPADRDRKGIAGSIFWAPTDKLDVTLDHYHLNAEDKPDLGSYINRTTGKVDDEFPAITQDNDYFESIIDTTTLKLGYQATENVRIENSTRIGTTTNSYVVTGAQYGTAIANEGQADEYTYDTATAKPKAASQDVDYFANTLNTYIDTELGGKKHQFVVSFEHSDHEVQRNDINVNNAGSPNCRVDGRGGITDGYCFKDENGQMVDNYNSLLAKQIGDESFYSLWRMKTTSVGLMDTVDVTDKLALHGGLRYDKFDLDLTTTTEHYDYSDGLWNGHVGFVYKVADNGNVYASYSTAANVNGGESDVATNGGYGGFIDADSIEPETVKSYELGTKWELNNKKLLATAALFQITKSNVMEPERGADYSNAGTPNTGENRVRGIELGLSGNLTDKLSGQISLTSMESEITESMYADNIGKPLSNFADNQANVLLRYQLTPKLALGGSMTYSSEMYAGQPDAAASESIEIPSYTVFDTFASYRVNKDLDMQLNINNLFDEDYYLAAYRSGAFAYKGDGRSIQLTLNYEF
ncbi:TonB-dependent receptor [Thiomicrorhabdus xiamenensis]|uniref:TonB-dependent siderophore receptor n=1 Tax=Thiomicrorhabdus xiamenensis TaxID=2739063 RepID=A0A7D4P3L7_9GAMM|nr:TonB-dependent siderophore receptor [Thiomicrorhabdus xiamenensis]QKI88215.1 TonB-dependent siderophore receptor [Thiomicrorhabdus xiamenensis]